eukprot:m.106557 g.106557  ORF g.106557 m.106557 type:complete len:570 (+) comp15155_c0_seq1:369-2078(+)
MSLLQLTNFGLSVGSTQLFENLNAHVVEGQRIALVGPNGCGKSTLLHALSQSTDASPNSSYFLVSSGAIRRCCEGEEWGDTALHVGQDNLEWARLLRITTLTEEDVRQLTIQDALEMATIEEGHMDEAVEDLEAWRKLTVAANDLLQWKTAQYDTISINELSPGCAVRAYLAIALLRCDVKLLLLDEPTNHLDLPSILWLQHAVIASGKAVVFVSHDVDFLDAVAEQLWHIDPLEHKVALSDAKYTSYLHARKLAREQQQAAHEAQQEKHKRLTAVAEKLKDASTAGSRAVAKDRDKLQRDFRRDRAGRSGRKAKALAVRMDKEQKIDAVLERKPLKIALKPIEPGIDSAILVDSVVLGYNDTPLPLAPITLRIDFGERIAIVGYNGVGKSTFLRTLTGGLHPLGGSVVVGRSLNIGNLMQEHESLPRDVTPRQHFATLTGLKPFSVGGKLITYGLTLRQVDCPIGELNSGARARALLASFSILNVNVLVLDEPTNHLDEEALEEVLLTVNEYPGTVIVVSHNRSFLQRLKVTSTYQLSSNGLMELKSVDEFLDMTDEAARKVVETCYA